MPSHVYSMNSLEELAEMFEMFADNANASPLQRTQREKELVGREVSTWRRAAEAVRLTKLTGA